MPEAELVFGGDGSCDPSPGTPASGGDGCQRMPLSRRAAPVVAPAPLISFAHRHALPSGSATNFVPSRDFTRNNTVCLPSVLASARPLRISAGVDTDLAADVENHVADLEAVLGGNATVGHRGDDNAVAAGILVGRRERQPELRHVGVGHVTLIVLIVRRHFLGRQSAERQRHGLVLAADGWCRASPKRRAPSCRSCAPVRARRGSACRRRKR